MGNSSFRFRHFEVRHDRCAMKVGTDGVLLGAWCGVDGVRTALDVGTGSGLIALMLCQRNAGLHAVGVEIDGMAAEQAAENFHGSPFAARLRAVQADFCTFDWGGTRFDLIVSNPPFYTQRVSSPDAQREQARRDDALPLSTCLARAAGLLNPGGRLSLILPAGRVAEAVGEAAACGLFLRRRCDVCPKEGKPVIRTLLEFGDMTDDSVFESLTIHEAGGRYSAAFAVLTQDFYLPKDGVGEIRVK